MSERMHFSIEAGGSRFNHRSLFFWVLWFFFLFGLLLGIRFSPVIPLYSLFSVRTFIESNSRTFSFFLLSALFSLPCIFCFLTAFSRIGWLFVPACFLLRGFGISYTFYCLTQSGASLRQVFIFLALTELWRIPSLFLLGEGSFNLALDSFLMIGDDSSQVDGIFLRLILSACFIALAVFARYCLYPFLANAAFL